MPSSTKRQARFMAACAHGAGYSSCPPLKVSREFNQADAGRSFSPGRAKKPALKKRGR